MNRSHERILADIEQRVQADGVPPDEVDAAIANVLGVPADYYFAYLLVWGAIEAHTHLGATKDERRHVTAVEPALDLAASLTDEIGRLAAAIHDASDRRGTPQSRRSDPGLRPRVAPAPPRPASGRRPDAN